jgi:hypothetical protein
MSRTVKQKSKTKVKTKVKSIKSKSSASKSINKIKHKISRKHVRKFEIERVNKIINILPQFVKFYKKLSDAEIRAIKFYKGHGSFWQTQLLTYKKKQIEIVVPFPLSIEKSFRRDVIGENADTLLPFLPSLDIKDMNKYIENSIKARLTLLNRLDTIFQRKDCPKLKGNEILFRGVYIYPELKNKKEGESILFKNFMSTTIDRNIAENFSSESCILIFTKMKNVPFIYMPNSKMYQENFVKFAISREINRDLSEYTLPRNLEFIITKIDEDYMSSVWGKNKSFKQIIKSLKNKGFYNTKYLDNENTKEKENENEPIMENDNNKTDNNILEDPKDEKDKIIEESLFSKIKIYYCTFKEYHKPEPLNYKTITKNAKFIIDQTALKSWKSKLDNLN